MGMKTVVKLGTFVSVLLFGLAVGYYAFIRLEATGRNRENSLFSLVPSSSVGVLECNDINVFFNDSPAWNYDDELNRLQFPGLFNFLIAELHKYTEQNAHGLSNELNRLLVSFHQPGTPRDQVVYFRVEMADGQMLSDILQEYMPSNFLPKEENYRGKTVWIYPLSHDEFLAAYTEEGFIVLSYQKRLVEEVIDALLDETSLNYDEVFSLLLEKKKKSPDSLTLYGRSASIPFLNVGEEAWSNYDFHLNSDVVYLTGDTYTSDNVACREQVVECLQEVPVVWEDGMLLSAERDSTSFYMGQAFDANDTGSRTLFNECVANLSNEAAFSLVADMQKVADDPERFRTYLPAFFLNHASLLRSFILSAQLSVNGERLSHLWVLTYKH